MSVRKVLRLLTLGAACLGAVAATAVTGILAMNSDQDAELFAANTRHYKGEWYNEGALVYEGYFTRGQNVSYEGPTPSKVDYTGEKIYIFSGWDTTGDNIPDIPVFKAYRNFKANATYTSIDASILEKIDWQKLLEILMDSNIDLEALLARLGLSPEDIARLLGLNVFTVTSNVAGPAYFRTESFKDYNKSGHNWTDADYYSTSNISPGSVNPLQFTANKLSSLKNDPLIASYCSEGTYEIQYNKSGGKYPVIAFESENTQGLSSDSYSLIQPDSENKYVSHGFPLIPCTEETVLAGLITPFSNDAIKNDEKTYRDYVRNEYLGISDEYRNYFSNLANQIGASKNNVGQAVTAFTEYLTNNFTLEYKRNEFPKSSDPLLYFMNEAKVADSNYFASAMTLFLRSLGYPARYTQGYMGAIAEVGVPTDVTALQAYSWCEVYVDGIGWMNADGAEYLLVKLFNEYYDLPEEVLDMMDFSNKGTSRTLESIRIGDNTKFNYVGGSNFSEDDIELIATYSDGYEEKVKPCYVAKPDISDYKNYYDRNVTVLYEYLTDIKSANYTIHVEPAKIEKLNAYNDKSYTVVTPLSVYDFTFEGEYNNGKTYTIDPSSIVYTFPEITEPGDYPLEFSYTEYYGTEDVRTVKTQFMLHVEAEPVILYIQPMYALQREFYTDEGFYFSRETWYAFRSNGEVTQITISDDMILNPDVLSVREPGEYVLRIQASETCEVYEYSFTIVENILEYLSVSLSSWTFYKPFDGPYVLTDNDITVTAHYTKPYDSRQIPLADLDVSQTIFEETGTYYIEIKYSEEFEFAGLVEVTEEAQINIDINEVVRITPSGSINGYIHVGEELSTEIYRDVSFIAYRKNGDYYSVDFNDPNISYDFSNVDRYSPGYYVVPVNYYCSESNTSVSTSVYLHVIGIESFQGYFGGLPEVLQTNITYGLEDFNKWGVYATVTYYDAVNYYTTEYVYPGDTRLDIDLGCPFDYPGSYSMTLYYNDGFEEAYDSTIITVVEYGVKDVVFDVSDIQDSYAYNETINFQDLSVTATYYDETEMTIYYDSGLINVTPISHGGSPEEVEYVLSVTIDGREYSESVFVNLIRPVAVYFGDEVSLTDHYTIEDLNLTNFPVYLEKDDGTVTRIYDSSLVTLTYTEEPHAGTNYVEIVYDDSIYGGTTVLTRLEEIELFSVELVVIITQDEFYEGDIFSDQFEAYIEFDGNGNVPETVDVTDTVFHDEKELESGDNSILFFMYVESLGNHKLENTVTVVAYHLESVEFDLSEFKTDYYRLDNIEDVDFSKIKVKGIYSDGNGGTLVKDIDINDCEITDFDLTTLGTDKTFTISYNTIKQKKSESFYYNVYEPMITDLTLDSSNCSLFAYQGVAAGIIDYSSLTYTLTYENGAKETFPYSVSGTNGSVNYTTPYIDNSTSVGTYSLQFTYTHAYWDGEQITSQQLGPHNVDSEIRENKVEALELNLLGVKKTFYIGNGYADEFTYSGLQVYALTSAYKDFPELGRYQLNSFEYDVSVDSLTIGKHTVYVTYNDNDEVFATYEIEVLEDTPRSYSVSNAPSTVKQGDPIDLSNVELIIYYASGHEEIIQQPDIQIGGSPSSATLGKTSFTVIYNDKVVSTQYINVVENTDILDNIWVDPSSISLVEGSTTEEYNAALDSITVYGEYRESGTVEIPKGSYSISGTVNLNKAGTYTVRISVKSGTKTVSTTLYVYVTESLKITSISINANLCFYVNEDIDFDAFFANAPMTIYFNIQDPKYTTLGDELVSFYNYEFPLIGEPTEPGEYLEAAIVVVLELDGTEYEFELTYSYYVVERS